MTTRRQRRILIALGVVALCSCGAILVTRGHQRALVMRDRKGTTSFAEGLNASPEVPLAPASAMGDSLQRQKAELAHKASPSPSVMNNAPRAGWRIPSRPLLDEPSAGQKLILAGQLTVEVKGYDEAFARVQSIAAEVGGSIASIQASRPEVDHAQGTLALRVPPSQYFQALNKLRNLGTVEEESSNTRDVTRDCLNLDARIKHRREMEARMWSTVQSRSSNLDSLLEADHNLSSVADTLDGMESERYRLQQDELLATISLALHEPAVLLAKDTPKPEKPGLWAPLRTSLRRAGAELIKDVSTLLYLGIVLLPWATLVWLLWRPIWKWVLRQKEPQSAHRLDIAPCDPTL